ncbi:MAG: glycosyltransferase [Burkholderiales bacterium]|nr:glycosyltransferase [Burkholderiales bacterium]
MNLGYTVALCTHNHCDRLERSLRELAALRSPRRPWELLLIDNGCTDGTPALLARHAWPTGWQVRVVREDKLGLSNARNRAIREARGEYIIFMDDDETADADWLCAYERLIDQEQPDAFGGRIRVQFEDMRPAWLQDELLGFLGELQRADSVVRLVDPHTSFYGGNFGFRRSVCERIGDFDSALGRKGGDNTGGEEVDFYRRLLAGGFSVWWTPEAIIHHRIQAAKLERSYFLDLHYRQGSMEGSRARGSRSRVPPKYLWPQLARASRRAAWQRLRRGAEHSLRLEMNVAYFVGYLRGWMRKAS